MRTPALALALLVASTPLDAYAQTQLTDAVWPFRAERFTTADGRQCDVTGIAMFSGEARPNEQSVQIVAEEVCSDGRSTASGGEFMEHCRFSGDQRKIAIVCRNPGASAPFARFELDVASPEEMSGQFISDRTLPVLFLRNREPPANSGFTRWE